MLLTEAKSKEVADRIRDAVEGALTVRNLSGRRASLDVVGHDGLIRDIRAGRIPSADRIEALFQYLGLEAYFGPKREAAVRPHLHLVGNMDPEENAPSGFVTIPLLSDDPGSSTAPVAFSRAWLDRQKLVPDFLKAVLPDRFDLDPPPASGSLALVVTSTTDREGTALWCYRDGSRVTVSNMTFMEDIAVVHPASRGGEPKIYRGRSAVLLGLVGKVVWIGQVVPVRGRIE